MKRYGGMTRPERFAAATQAVAPLPIPMPLQNVVVDERRLLTVPWVSFFQWILNVGTRTYTEGTHAERIDPSDKHSPAKYRPGTWFYETDRTVLYQVRIVGDEPQWVYVAGTMRNTLALIPVDLAAYDAGFLFYGTDYAHTWRWTGTVWEYAPGDRTSGEFAWFAADPGTGWKLCNGTSTTRSKTDATTAAFATPNLIGCYPKGAAAYTGAVVSASGSISGTTGTESSHTHAVTTAAVASGVGDIDSPVYQVSGAGVGVRNEWHRHNVPGQTVTSGAGSAHSHDLGTVALSGVEPWHVDLLPYFRR
jgi:hypothetical protein